MEHGVVEDDLPCSEMTRLRTMSCLLATRMTTLWRLAGLNSCRHDWAYWNDARSVTEYTTIFASTKSRLLFACTQQTAHLMQRTTCTINLNRGLEGEAPSRVRGQRPWWELGAKAPEGESLCPFSHKRGGKTDRSHPCPRQTASRRHWSVPIILVNGVRPPICSCLDSPLIGLIWIFGWHVWNTGKAFFTDEAHLQPVKQFEIAYAVYDSQSIHFAVEFAVRHHTAKQESFRVDFQNVSPVLRRELFNWFFAKSNLLQGLLENLLQKVSGRVFN